MLLERTGLDPELLLIKRARRENDPWSGQMALPGGRKDDVDLDLFDTVQRETFEETSVNLSGEQLLGELDDLHPHAPGLPPMIVRPFVFGLNTRPPIMLNSESTLFLWAPLGVLADSAGVSRVVVGDRAIVTPSYRAGAHVVWGMTQRIINPIIELWK